MAKSTDKNAPIQPDAGTPRFSSEKPVRRFRIAVQVLLQVLLAFIIFFQLNFLSCRHYQRWDLTQNRKFTLSGQTLNFLGSLDSDMQIVMAFLRGSDVYEDVKGLISEYERHSKGKVSVEILDPSRDRERLIDLKNQHNLTFSRNMLVILSGNRTKVIGEEDLLTRTNDQYQRVIEFRGEEVLTSKLLEISERQQKKLYLLAGLRKADEINGILTQLAPLAATQNARVEALNLANVTELPEDADAIIVPGPSKDISGREAELLNQFWEEKKGGLFILLDPAAETPNLYALVRSVGVAPRDDRILSVVSIPGMATRKTYDVPIFFQPGSEVTRDLRGLRSELPGQTQSLGLFIDEPMLISKGILVTPLAAAAPGFWGETDYFEEVVSANEEQDNVMPLYTAAAVEKGAASDPNLKIRSSRMVVVSNPNLISPTGMSVKTNIDFAMAAINWMVDRAEMIGISPKQPSAYTLDITPTRMGLIQTLMIVVLPGIACILGLFVWLARRN